MFRSLLVAVALISAPAAAEEVSYDKCREIVSQTDFVLGTQSECGVRLDLEAAALYKQCYTRLSQFHIDAAREHARGIMIDMKAKTGSQFCPDVKQIFAPILMQ